MKLLLDENISDRILPRIHDLYPGSTHEKLQGLLHRDDSAIWEFSKTGGYLIVSKDWDFHQLSLLRGFPPKGHKFSLAHPPISTTLNERVGILFACVFSRWLSVAEASDQRAETTARRLN